MMKRNISPCVASVVVSSISTLVLAAAAVAAPESAEPDEATSPESHDVLNEVVVTAQRREQRLKDVGISVSAISSESLKQMNIENAYDLVRAVPSLKMNAFSSAAVVWNIRGVSQNDYGDQQEPPVAVYQDDSYSSSLNTASFPTFDLARVEVLRGPQGTLFGRNATGGAIQFISNKPTKVFEGYGTVTFGKYNQQVYEAAVSGPISDNLQGRLAVIRDTSDGYIKNVSPGASDYFGTHHYALRGILAWQPAEGTNVNLTLRFLRAPNERQAGGYSFDPACPNEHLQGEYLAPDASCAFWGNAPGSDANNYRNDAITPHRGGDPWTTAGTDFAKDDRRFFGASVRADTTIGDLSIVSITDYQDSRKNYLEDGDSSPQWDVNFILDNRLKQLSQELRASERFGANELVAGLFWMRVNGDYNGGFPIHFIGYEPQVQYSQDTTSFAAFAQDEWTLNDEFKLIGGLRYWRDNRVGSYFGTAPASDITGQPEVDIIFNRKQIYPSGSLITPADADKTYSGLTARAELDYKPTPDVLLYGSYNRGSKSGGFTFSTGTPFDPNETAFLNGIPFKPEVLQAYEIGTKATLSGTTAINASAFYYDYHDYQAFAQVGVIQTVVNMDARALGAELEIFSRPVRGLFLQLSASWLDSRVKNVLLPDAQTIVDHDLPQAPRFSGNALARYEHPLPSGWTGSFQTDILYSGRFCFTVLCAPVEKEQPYAVTNVRLGLSAPGGSLEFAAFVNNVTNRAYRQYAFDSSQFAGIALGIYAKPRTWGVTATYRFGAAAR
jgi:iron complex outermembrane recepter protein